MRSRALARTRCASRALARTRCASRALARTRCASRARSRTRCASRALAPGAAVAAGIRSSARAEPEQAGLGPRAPKRSEALPSTRKRGWGPARSVWGGGPRRRRGEGSSKTPPGKLSGLPRPSREAQRSSKTPPGSSAVFQDPPGKLSDT
ncbi:hypothetical protein DB32_007490 [Sandaracinus amylolyticus]|uniref:Uncharacterized protein n=1 Tax=Sandaracinus amylolyticus TaxID=927083 RepID=A0A0F6YM66_9BACT|nr:hypothetical protein DB32_007490 [Sandaracinus amylolyticus]